MRAIRAILSLVLTSIITATTAVAADYSPGRWIALSTEDGLLVAGANLDVSKSGKVTGRAIYYNGGITRMSGRVTGRKVSMVEKASGFRSTWSGTIKTNGKAAVIKTNTGVKAYAAKVKSSVPEAGVYHGSDSFGDSFAAMVAIDGSTTVLFNDGTNIFMIKGKTKNGVTNLLSSDGLIRATGTIKNGVVTGKGTSGGSDFTFRGKYL